ncbi:kinase-like protein [Annulohypoxylon nitens]|nr:kinase-like protein [Annulohypoxylon nitens]
MNHTDTIRFVEIDVAMSAFDDAAVILKEYFSKDPRFEYVDYIANGAHGSTHQIRYKDPNRPQLQHFIVKKAFPAPESQRMIEKERNALKILRGARHIVQPLTILNDPLAVPTKGAGKPIGEYIIMEWIPNGTIQKFIKWARAHDVVRLPNRLLWRFLFCMVRACTGLAYPIGRTDDIVVDEEPRLDVPPSMGTHGDLHRNNILVGDFLQLPEHGIAPILKFIDFGSASDSEGVPRNLWDIGKIMVALIILSTDDVIRQSPFVTPYLFIYNYTIILSQAHPILPPASHGGELTWLDSDLAVLVALLLATRPTDRPDLFKVHNICQHAIAHRTAEFYGDPTTESDKVVRELCELIVLSPAYDPPEPMDIDIY